MQQKVDLAITNVLQDQCYPLLSPSGSPLPPIICVTWTPVPGWGHVFISYVESTHGDMKPKQWRRYIHSALQWPSYLCNKIWTSGYIPSNICTLVLLVCFVRVMSWFCVTCLPISWWRHQMEAFSALLTICACNSPVPGKFPAQRPVRRSFDVFFDLRLNKRLSKHSWGWWFETPSCPLWRHHNVLKA